MQAMIEKRKKDLFSTIKTSLEQRLQSCCQIFGADDKSNIYLIGTGIILDVNLDLFLVTAAHVFDENRSTTLYTILNGKTEEIGGEFYSTIAESGNRIDDKLDIAVWKVKDGLVDKFRSSYSALTISDIHFSDKPERNNFYAFLGFPSSKTKAAYRTFSIKSTPYSFMNTVASTDKYESLNLSEETHIVIDFNEEKTLDEVCNMSNFPRPYGMSGGGVWLLNDSTSKLAGIGIEYNKRKHVLIGTKIDVALNIIKKYFSNKL